MLKKMLKSRRLTMLERDKRSWKESQDLLLRRLKMRNWNCKGNSRQPIKSNPNPFCCHMAVTRPYGSCKALVWWRR